MNIIIYTRRIGRYLERKYARRLRRRFIEIKNSREIFSRHKERIW